MTADELAARSRYHRPAVEAWFSAALAYRFINSVGGGKAALTTRMARLLTDRTSPQYLGGQFSYLALRSLEYGTIADLFRKGRAMSMRRSYNAVEEATHWDHFAFMRAIKRQRRLDSILARGGVLADVGCGTGTLIAKLSDRYPKSRYIGIEPSIRAVAAARKRLKDKPATIIKMKGEKMRFASEFDIVYLGESLYAAADKNKVLASCYKSLKPGGTIAVVEGLLGGDLSEENMIIMGMQIDFALQGNKFMSTSEVKALLGRAGFKTPKLEPLGGSVYLVTARK
jgi:SAM-dependent methyltransferase